MNWGAIAPALGTLGGIGAMAAFGPAAAPGAASLFGVGLPELALGATAGGATGMIGGQLAPKGMPPPPATQLPGSKGGQFGGGQTVAQQFMPPQPGMKGYLQHPFVR